ncbi:MAG: MFS transporter [Gammaproteobacteria bacterium]|nr:MFS transporter [Gammaproteobacteria bacterium]MYF38698.1 MFS transporter [Gammaproteobacteria bacterium]
MFLRKLNRRFPALLYPSFRRYWYGSFASVSASNLLYVGQLWLVEEMTGSEVHLGFLGAMMAVPGIVMNLIGGVIADRMNKRTLLLCTSLCNATLIGLLTFLDFTNLVRVWHVYTIAAALSLITGIDWPVRASIYPSLVRRHSYLSAVSLNAFVWQSNRMIAPAIGGLILWIGGTSVVFSVCTFGFLVMFFVLLTIPMPDSELTDESSAWQELRDGVRFIFKHPLFRWLTLLTFLGMFFVQSYVQQMSRFTELLGQGEREFGLLLAAGGLGSVVGTLIVASMRRNRWLGYVMLGGGFTSAAATLAFAFAASNQLYYVALICAVAGALLGSFFLINAMTTMQLAVPQHLRGRVMGINTIGFNLVPLGGLFLGLVATKSSLLVAVGLGVAVYSVFAVLSLVSSTSLRQLGRTTIREIQE